LVTLQKIVPIILWWRYYSRWYERLFGENENQAALWRKSNIRRQKLILRFSSRSVSVPFCLFNLNWWSIETQEIEPHKASNDFVRYVVVIWSQNNNSAKEAQSQLQVLQKTNKSKFLHFNISGLMFLEENKRLLNTWRNATLCNAKLNWNTPL
jgi:hypothetical protein